MIDFHQRATAVGADPIAHFESSPSLLSAARDIVIVGGISDEHEIVFGAVWVGAEISDGADLELVQESQWHRYC